MELDLRYEMWRPAAVLQEALQPLVGDGYNPSHYLRVLFFVCLALGTKEWGFDVRRLHRGHP